MELDEWLVVLLHVYLFMFVVFLQNVWEPRFVASPSSVTSFFVWTQRSPGEEEVPKKKKKRSQRKKCLYETSRDDDELCVFQSLLSKEFQWVIERESWFLLLMEV